MPKAKPVKKNKKDSPAQEVGSVTFSTRFTEAQRDRIVAAAEVRGWTPSNFMRVATIEKSVHILNTSKQTQLDFTRVAAKLAKQLMNPKVWIADDSGDRRLEDGTGDWTSEVDPLSPAEIQDLKDAARLGGLELFNMIIDACENHLEPDRKNLPKPIEPD